MPTVSSQRMFCKDIMEVNNTPKNDDDYLRRYSSNSDARPVIPCRIKAEPVPPDGYEVYVKSDKLRFTGQNTVSKDLLLPASGTWVPFEISGSYYDYTIKPCNQSDTAPCDFYRTGRFCWLVTLNGTVVHSQNINNMLWAVFGRSWGWNSLALETGAHINQINRYFQEKDSSVFWDTSGSQNAIRSGSWLFELPAPTTLNDLKGMLTPKDVKLMRDTSIYGDDKFWPCNEPYDPDKSILQRPDLMLWNNN